MLRWTAAPPPDERSETGLPARVSVEVGLGLEMSMHLSVEGVKAFRRLLERNQFPGDITIQGSIHLWGLPCAVYAHRSKIDMRAGCRDAVCFPQSEVPWNLGPSSGE